MKRIVTVVALSALAAAVPAQAKPGDSGQRADRAPSQERAGKAQGKVSAKSKRCEPRKAGYVAHGLYVSSDLVQVAGADTPKLGDDRYDGTVVVDVKRANRAARADKGTQKTYTVAGVRVRFADRNDDDVRDQPVAGDRVKVDGKVTTLRGGCDAAEFTPELTVRSVKFLAPPDEEPEEAPPAPAPAPAPAP